MRIRLRSQMPPRGDRQGFKIGRNGRRYWIASQARRSGTYGFPDRCIELPAEIVTAEQIAEFCRFHNARLDAWIEQHKTAQETTARTPSRSEITRVRPQKAKTQSPYLSGVTA
ncbi:MAG TPA: hypothetical protein VNK91_12220 [Burkholderiaceae bacterium]|nr:hypothetical protein [Burkholderiaceae bacterium]